MLGSVKFALANSQDVYLHDTPQKSMFAEPVRAESFGTVRVQNADRLALILLKRDQGWTDRRVAAATQNGSDQHVALKQPIPIYLTYFTLSVNGDGSISTFRDIYDRDARMAAALFSNDVASDSETDNNGMFMSHELQGAQMRPRGTVGNAIAESVSQFIDN